LSTQWEEYLKFLDYGSLMDDAQFDFTSTEFSSDELLEKERAVLGMAIAHDPFIPYQHLIKQRGLASLSTLSSKHVSLVLVRIADVKTITTKTQKSMAFVKIESDTMNTEAVAFPEIYSAHAKHLRAGAVCILGLRQQTNQQKQSIIIESVEELS
jgi:DNA polymerase III alpha subunit